MDHHCDDPSCRFCADPSLNAAAPYLSEDDPIVVDPNAPEPKMPTFLVENDGVNPPTVTAVVGGEPPAEEPYWRGCSKGCGYRCNNFPTCAGGEPTRPTWQEWVEAAYECADQQDRVLGAPHIEHVTRPMDILAPLIERERADATRAAALEREDVLAVLLSETYHEEGVLIVLAQLREARAAADRVVAAVEAWHRDTTWGACICGAALPCPTLAAARGATGGGT